MSKHQTNTALFILISLFIFIFLRENVWGYWLGLVILWLGITAFGSFNIALNYHLKALHKKSGETKNRIAFTFDDGPTEFTPQVLELLKEYGQKATFFCIGKQAEKFPEIVGKIVSEGHIIGNHTYSHSNKTGFLNTLEMTEEIEKADGVLFKIMGKRPKFYRPPFGVTNPSVAKAVKVTGHTVIGWSVRSLDTVIREEERIERRILKGIEAGSVILMHDTTQKSVDVLKKILERSPRYQSVSIDELFNLQAYEI